MRNQEKPYQKNSTIQSYKEKCVDLINSKPEPSMLVNGKVVLEMAKESKSGQMELNTSENGKKIEPMVKVNLSM